MNEKRRAGPQRQYWAIRAFLDSKGHSMSSFGKKLNVTGELIGRTVRGQENNNRVLVALIEEGCPIEYLDLPSSMKMEMVA